MDTHLRHRSDDPQFQFWLQAHSGPSDPARSDADIAFDSEWAKLWGECIPYARGLVGANDAEDLVQEATMNLLRALKAGRLYDGSFRAVVYKVIRNAAIDRARARARRPTHVALGHADADGPSPDRLVASSAPNPEQLVLSVEDRQERQREMHCRFQARCDRWHAWVRCMRVATRRPARRTPRRACKPVRRRDRFGARGLLAAVAAYARSLEREATWWQRSDRPDALVELARLDVALSLEHVNDFIRGRGIARNRIDLAWSRVKRMSASASLALPPGIPPRRSLVRASARHHWPASCVTGHDLDAAASVQLNQSRRSASSS